MLVQLRICKRRCRVPTFQSSSQGMRLLASTPFKSAGTARVTPEERWGWKLRLVDCRRENVSEGPDEIHVCAQARATTLGRSDRRRQAVQ